MSFPTVYYITQVIPPCYTAGYAMCVCVSFGACVYRSLGLPQTISDDVTDNPWLFLLKRYNSVPITLMLLNVNLSYS